MAVQDTAIRKRQQIANANRMMFMWVAAVSVIVGFAIVASLFLYQKAQFNEKVLGVKSKTVATLVANNKNVNDLKDQVRVLNTNEALKASMAVNEDQPIQVVLDALPADANSSAFGASLQEKFLKTTDLKVESLSVDPIIGAESQTSSNVLNASSGATAPQNNQITFKFSVSSDINNASALKSLLQRLERSIRAIDLTSVTIETQGNRLVLTVNGRAFYEPSQTIELKDKLVKP
jgi:hypothetical protein